MNTRTNSLIKFVYTFYVGEFVPIVKPSILLFFCALDINRSFTSNLLAFRFVRIFNHIMRSVILHLVKMEQIKPTTANLIFYLNENLVYKNKGVNRYRKHFTFVL